MNATMSESIADLAAALAAAQGEMRDAAKNKVNPHFRSKYADLASIWEACRGPLSRHGLSVVQAPGLVGEDLCLHTLILHQSGQWVRGVYPIRPIKPDPQGVGSAISYARRYALAAMVGVCADEDDDGEAATHRAPAREQRSGHAAANGEAHAPDEPHVDEAGEVRPSWAVWSGCRLAKANEDWRHEYEHAEIVPQKSREMLCNEYQLNGHLLKWSIARGWPTKIPERQTAAWQASKAAVLWYQRPAIVEAEVDAYLARLLARARLDCGLAYGDAEVATAEARAEDRHPDYEGQSQEREPGSDG